MKNALFNICTGLLVSGSCLMGCGAASDGTVGISEEAVTGTWEAPTTISPLTAPKDFTLGTSGGAGPLPVCQAVTPSGYWHPGKFYNKTCRVEWGGNVTETASFNLLVDAGYHWVTMTYGKAMPQTFVQGGFVGPGAGSTDPGQIMGICEASINGTWHVGKFWTPSGFFPRCQYELSDRGAYTEQNGNVGNTIQLLIK